MIRHAIRVAAATIHITSARDLPEITISHAAGHGLPIKDNLRPVIARRGPMTGAANPSEHPKEDGFPSEHPREDGSRRPPAADGDRQHLLAVGGSSGVEGSPVPLLHRDHAPMRRVVLIVSIARYEIRGPTASASGDRHRPPVAMMHHRACRARMRNPAGCPITRSLPLPDGDAAQRPVADRVSRHKLHRPAAATDGAAAADGESTHLHPVMVGAPSEEASAGGISMLLRPGLWTGRLRNPTAGEMEINGRRATARLRPRRCPPSAQRHCQARQMAGPFPSAGARMRHQCSTHRAAVMITVRRESRCQMHPHRRMLSCPMVSIM